MEGNAVRIIFIFDKNSDGSYETLQSFFEKLLRHFDIKIYNPIINGDYIIHIKHESSK